MTRVQIKTKNGTQWLSARIDRRHSGSLISDTVLVRDSDWRDRHLALLRHNYRESPYFELMTEFAGALYGYTGDDLAGFNQHAIEYIAAWLELEPTFAVSSDLSIPGSGTQRLVDICKHFGATEYLTGHGAMQYLNHELFDACAIDVSYMNYELNQYEQLHGEFTPYVSILDAIANIGEKCRDLLTSDSIDWRTFTAMQRASGNHPEQP